MQRKRAIQLVLMFNPASAGLRAMVEGILAAQTRGEFQVMTSDLPGLRPVLSEARYEADGWLMYAGNNEVARKFARRQRRIPIINLSAGLANNPLPSVWPDNVEIGQLAGKHLLATGLSTFAYVGNPSAEHYGVLRLEGFRQALGAKPCALLDGVPPSVPTTAAWHELRRKLVRWLAGLPIPCGVLAADDARAVMVSRACQRAGLRVPEDIAIVGVNNDDALCAFGNPPLTSIALPWHQIGRHVAAAMANLVRGRRRPVRPILVSGSRLIERRSTQTVTSDDPDFAKAVRFIPEAAPHRPLSLTEVTTHVVSSRSTLERRFRRYLGHAIGEEIAATRERRIRSLLRDTSGSIKQIAAVMGFRRVGDLTRFCRNRTGLNPLALRSTSRND